MSPPVSPVVRKYAAVGIAIAVIVVAGVATWLQQGQKMLEPGSSTVMDLPGERHVRVSENGVLRVQFPYAMDEQSVGEHMTIEPAVPGSVSWENRQTLAFHPASPLTRSGTYTFVVQADTERADGALLGREIVVHYFIAGPPRVSTQLPPPESDDAPADQPITIIFDRPMVALTTLSERGSQFSDWPVKVEPAIDGAWRWISTNTAEFTPKTGLTLGTAYTVSVPAGITSVSGESTTEDFSWAFQTSKPRVINADPPPDFTTTSPTVEVVLNFNQEIDLASVKSHARIFQSSTNDPLSKQDIAKFRETSPSANVAITIPFKSVVYGTTEVDGKKVTDKTTAVLIPERPLNLDTWHGLLVDDGVKSPGGTLGSTAPYIAQFKTAGPMKALSIREEYGSLVVEFTNPFDGETVPKGVTIDPKPADWDDMGIIDNSWGGTSLYLYPTLEPSTEYTVKITGELKDQFGQSTVMEKPFTFRTKPIAPRVFIHSNGQFGVFERGFAPVYYLNAVNVSSMDIAFAKLALPEFLSEQQALYNDWQHIPDLQGKSMMKSWNIPLKEKENEWKSIPFDLEERVGAQLTPGIYALSVMAPEYKDEYSGHQTAEKIFFSISNTVLTLKFSGGSALVWAVDMKTGAPVANAKVAFHSNDGKTVYEGHTDAEGFLEYALDASAFAMDENTWRPEIWVTLETKDDFAFVGSTWDSGMTPWDFSFTDDFTESKNSDRLMSYIYTDRPLYRTGDTVHFKGIVRLLDNRGALHPPASPRTVRVRIDNAEAVTIYDETLPFNAFGSFIGELPIDTSASLGTYWINIELEPTEGIYANYASASFDVLAYRKPEYRIDVNFDREEYFAGEKVNAEVRGAYYFGMSMDGARVYWNAMRTDYYFNRYTDGWYSFSMQDSWCWYNCGENAEQLATGEGKLDHEGRFKVSIPVTFEEEPLSQVFSLDVDITDESGQVVSTRASVPVHKNAVYVGLRSDDYAVEPSGEASISLVTVKPDGSVAGNQRVDLAVHKRTWNTTRKKGVDGQYYYDNESKDDLVQGGITVTTRADGKATTKVKIPSGGEFIIRATTRDSAGRTAIAETGVYAWSDMYVNWPHTNSSRMTVVADKPEYRVGEKATIIAQSPFQGDNVMALVTIEREGILKRQVITLKGSAQPIEIPITEDLIPNAYVSVVVLKPRVGETFNEFGLDTGSPAFRIGYVQLRVENKPKAMTVSIEPNKRRYLPGEEVKVDLMTADWQGRPASAEVSLAVVDMSVLALTGFSKPNLLDFFYADRGLGIRSAINLLYLLERFKPGSKGGGGGDLEDRARGNFRDTAYWNPTILTDESGRASVSFTLPDNLTTWQLLAIAHTKESLVGAEATEVVETKRVIVRPVRPRFAVHGDSATLGAIVHNGTEQEQTFTVSLAGKGFTGGKMKEQVKVPADGMAEISFPVTFDYASRAEFVFTAEGQGVRDEVREEIPLMPFGLPQSTATSGITDATVTENLFVPLRAEATAAQATATLSPTLATYLPGGLEYLVQFPYGCAEQTASSFLPNIAVAKLQGFDAFKVVSDEELQEKVTKGIERLLTFRQSDNGFGYWADSSGSYPYLSAYILYALHQAREAGYAVGATVIAQTREYLQETLRSSDSESVVDLSERAYILFVLGETGSADMSLLSNLYGKKDQLAIFGKAQLAMSLKRAGDDRRALSLLREILATAKTSSRGVHFEEPNGWSYHSLMSTDSRTTAIVLEAIMRIDPANELAPKIVRAMLTMRQRGHWDTTQATVQSIFALIEYLKTTKELEGNFKSSLTLNGEEIASAVFDASSILSQEKEVIPEEKLKPGQMNALQILKEGTGRLYYDVLLTYFWKTKEILPAEEGISIVREIELVSGSPEHPEVGGTYRVKLTISAPEDRNFVAIESPHPAGFEGIDFALKTTQQHLEDELETQNEDRWWWDPWWVFNHKEFRDDQVFLFADSLPAGVYHYEYLVRATLPGTFLWRPARAYEMYFPEVFGNTEGSVIDVRESGQ